MTHEVRLERAAARPLAAVSGATARGRLGEEIVRRLDRVWSLLREGGVASGHNVVVYRGAEGGALLVDVGVEVFADFEERGDVRRVATPAGPVATTVHLGDYSAMAPAYDALEQWCRDARRRPTGVSWEIYGDWEEDAARRRTDLFLLLEPAGAGRLDEAGSG